ncbi:MAG: 3-deoxy-D-manno-octulosonic acid transferase [Planctomycetota bacterium]|nr:3-deoxy-D-manno-octulosonic acid transferase [Planctomycetota bacterium]
MTADKKTRPSVLGSLILDAAYLTAGVPVLAAGLLRGRLGRVWDHLRRRAFDAVPERPTGRPALWLHGVSVGEVLSARRLLEKIVEDFPAWDIVVSSSTRLGHEAARRDFAKHTVISFPLDLGFLVRRALRRLRPDVVVIVEHDLWPNFLRSTIARGLPVVVVNARLSRRSLRGYRRLSRLYRWPPRELAAICVQDDASARSFQELGFSPEKIHVTGNLKFDNPPPPAAEGFRRQLGFDDGDWVLVAGSTHEGEEEAVLDTFGRIRRSDSRAFLILVPRRIERTSEVAELVRSRGLSLGLWSEGPRRGPDVLLVDTVGELPRICAVGDVVFVGGSLVPVGGHNVIEPAALGRPVLVGPHYHNARSVVETFLERDALVVVQDAGHLARAVAELKEDPEAARQLGERAAKTVEENVGGVEKTLSVLRGFLEGTSPRNPL